MAGDAASDGRPWPTLRLFLLLVALFGLYAGLCGPTVAGDTGEYVQWADRLTASGFDYFKIVRAHGEPLAATYALFVSLVACLRLVAGDGWAACLVALNVLSLAGVGALLSSLAVRVSGERSAGWAALSLYLLCHDVRQWAPELLSDSVFLLIAFYVFRMEAGRLLAPARGWTAVFAASAAASLFRPTGIVLFPVTAWSWLLSRTPRSQRSRALALLGLCAAGLIASGLFALLAMDPASWPFAAGAKAMREIGRSYAEGVVVWDRPETYHAPPHGPFAYWAVAADRFRWFFSPGASAFSPSHWLAQIAFFGPAYGLALFLLFRLATGRSGLDKGGRDVCNAALGAILLYAFFHAIVQVDYGWRYRIPILPHLILLAACGFAVAARAAPKLRGFSQFLGRPRAAGSAPAH